MPRKRRQYGTGSVYKRKSDGRWIGAAVVDSHGRRVTVSAKTETEAKRRLEAKQREIARHGAPAPGSQQATVASWATEWLAMKQTTLRPRSFSTTRSAVNKWVVPTIGNKRLHRLTPADIRAVSEAVVEAGRTSTTAQRAHIDLIAMLTDAAHEGHDVPDRVLHIKAPAREDRERTDIPLAEAVALLQAASRHADGSRWVAALLQGMRQGECLGLTWDMVDLEHGTMDISWQLQAIPYIDRANKHLGFRVPHGYAMVPLVGQMHLVRPKTSRGQRVIPLVPWMSQALAGWREQAPHSPYGLVWPDADGDPRDPAADTEAWQALQAEAGLSRRYVLHEARHTAATLLFEAKVDEAVIKAILGHSSIITSRAYQHTRLDQARTALDQVAGRLGLDA